MNTLTLHSGEIIFRQKDFAESMFDIVSGKVGIFSNYGTDTETKIAELGEGQIFGEMGMIEYFPRSATAVALEETVLTEIKEDELKTYFRDKPEKLLRIMRLLSQRIRDTNEKYIAVCRSVSEHESLDTMDPDTMDAAWIEMERYAMDYWLHWH